MLTFEFNNVSDYLSAKGGSGSITTALTISDPTNLLSKSAVSFIKKTGQSFIDAVNVIVEERYGDIGDTLLYDSTSSKYFWLKSRAAWSQYSGSLGSVTCSSISHITAKYTVIGTLVYRNGNDGLIMSDDDIGSIPWCLCSDGSTYAISFSNMPNDKYDVSTRRSVNRPGWCSSIGLAFRERLGDSSYNQYSNPFPRSAWNAMMYAFQVGSNAGANGEGGTGTSAYTTSPTTWSWKVEKSNNIVTATFSYNFVGSVNYGCNPADFGYLFDRFYKDCIEIDNLNANGAVIGELSEGKDATRRMLDFIASYNSSNSSNPITQSAALSCDAYYKIATNNSQFGLYKWWLPSMKELTYATKQDAVLYAKGTNIAAEQYIWTSSQYSQYAAWIVLSLASSCVASYYGKILGFRVRAFAAYHFPKS